MFFSRATLPSLLPCPLPQAMSLMLPHQSRNPAEDNTVEGRLQNIASCGYLAIARSNAELGAVLDRVKVSLRGGWERAGGLLGLLAVANTNPKLGAVLDQKGNEGGPACAALHHCRRTTCAASSAL